MWEFISAIVEKRPAVPSFYDGWNAQIVADAVLESHAKRTVGGYAAWEAVTRPEIVGREARCPPAVREIRWGVNSLSITESRSSPY